MTKFWLHRLVLALLLVSLTGSNFNLSAHASPLQEPLRSVSQLSKLTGNSQVIPSGFKVVSSTPNSLILELRAPAYRLEASMIPGQSCQDLVANGYFQSSLPGDPGVLSAGVMLGIPLDTTPSLTILSMESVDLPRQIHLCPVATPIFKRNQPGKVVLQEYELSQNFLSYSQKAFFPSEPVELNISGMIRGQRVARLDFTPFLYNPEREAVRVVSHVKVALHFVFNGTPSVQVDESSFESLLSDTLINYDQARPWRDQSQQNPLKYAAFVNTQPYELPAYKIQVDQDGVYQITYQALQSAGVPVDDLDPRTIKLFNQEVEIPIYVVGEEDGIFNLEDYLIFYGQKITTKFTNTNIYWLDWGDGTGQRMSDQDGTVNNGEVPVSFRSTLHLEEDELYVNESLSGPQNDHWYWYFLNAFNAPVIQDIPFTLQNLDPSATTATVRGLLKGYFAEPQHHTLISINGYLIADHIWPSEGEYAFEINVPASYIVEGDNILTVTLPHDGDILYDYELANWFEIDYDRTFTAQNDLLEFAQPNQWQFQVKGFTNDAIDVFEISDPLNPIHILGGSITPDNTLYQINFKQQLSGEHSYVLLSPASWLTPKAITKDNPSGLKDPTNEADYIIISHSDFLSIVQPLVAYHASEGMRVKVVDVQDVYDEFNGGVFDPQAIQDFLAFAYSQWIVPVPSYVLLVGDGHYDFKDNYKIGIPNYIPPFLGEFDPWIGETVSDNRFVTVSGDDILPDMFIGRLPANSVSEAAAMVNKVLAYESVPIQGDWNAHLTFVADNVDAGGNFPVFSNNIADHYLTNDYIAQKIYYGIPPYGNIADTQAAIINAINEGRLIVNYNGHASVQNWASEGLFGITSIGNLTNTGMFPLFLPMTCQEGYFIWPDFPSLAESVVRAGDKGAIASWSPSGFGLSNGHDMLARSVYHAFFDYGLTRFGPATTYAKYYLEANGHNYDDLLDTYNLLGDPAVRLKILPLSIRLPLVTR